MNEDSMLPLQWYQCNDVVRIARELVGKVLVMQDNGSALRGIITETEAYAGVTDKASHAYGGRRTRRTETMYLPGGCTYVYLCYGIHALLNVVTGSEGNPHAVLLRGVYLLKENEEAYPAEVEKQRYAQGYGPGKLTKLMGIGLRHNARPLTVKNGLWIEDSGIVVPAERIVVSPRIGVDYAGEDARLPYRFTWKM